MKRILYTLLFLSIFSSPSKATDCFNGRYKNKVFNDFTLINNVVYARKQRSDGIWQNLAYDVYLPKNDTATNRPAVVLAHGGGYIDLLDQKSPDIVELAIDLVERGYVVISIEYREEPSPFSLLVEENMVKAVCRALIDTRDATCSIVDTTVNFGNPYKIDKEKVIVGGVSAGAVSFLHALFLDSISWMPERYQQWALQVEPNSQALLNNRYCGAHVLGMIGVSGAILDTNWILPGRTYPALLLQHGTADAIVPFKYDNPFHIPSLPKLMGSYLINQRCQNLGFRCELETWVGYGHVPFLGSENGLNLQALFTRNPLGFVLNPVVLDSTKNHIAHFCYSLIDCNERTTGIRENIISSNLGIFPNPSKGNFYIQTPKDITTKKWDVTIFDIVGKEKFHSEFPGNSEFISVGENFPPGMYVIKLHGEHNNESLAYTGKVTVLE
ncbi:MAG: hypothetical protein JWN78_1557 [Bacteroidota bacterium]|nr:hypothetical protein [Bacteroidota bacterium]